MDAVDGLNGRIEALTEQIDVLKYELDQANELLEETKDDLSEAEQDRDKYQSRLEEAADILANLDIITNTPYAKREWIEGE